MSIATPHPASPRAACVPFFLGGEDTDLHINNSPLVEAEWSIDMVEGSMASDGTAAVWLDPLPPVMLVSGSGGGDEADTRQLLQDFAAATRCALNELNWQLQREGRSTQVHRFGMVVVCQSNSSWCGR